MWPRESEDDFNLSIKGPAENHCSPIPVLPIQNFFFLEPGNTVLTQKDHKTEKKIQILNILSRSLNLLKKGKK